MITTIIVNIEVLGWTYSLITANSVTMTDYYEHIIKKKRICANQKK